MTPSARVKAAIDILDTVIAGARGNGPPADRIIADWARGNRYAGSKDRRAIRELVYAAIRACGEVPVSGRAAMLALTKQQPELREMFDGSQYGPDEIEPGEPVANLDTAPRWLREEMMGSGLDREEQDALSARAPLDLRVNTLKARRDTLTLPETADATAAPHGLRLDTGLRVEDWDAWKSGAVEVQDTGSQIACLAAGASAGMTVVDLCAGAGGKTLALAAMMGNEGRILAADTSRARLQKLPERAERAGVTIAETVLLNPGHEMDALTQVEGDADIVFVDAPCSGTGTWRRNPEARWRVTPASLKEQAALQSRLLDLAARLVKPGGRVVYVVCSLLDVEGAEQGEAFLSRNPGFSADTPDLPLGRRRGTGMRLTPLHDATDGFFIARYISPC
ncbi:RsmB/NOP family class I SAM-dependent RNA methyltransferase [Croceicoccus sp. YJ47]|uniref:RsmB/NOP family class I SAM-dependent RNA methyltransferase n=1 Tax=Croceicoccus sp. YJ47 TaxID=2798724 RepID=UPI001922FF68|nr:RsmB/NOP family class I SAM-dependent RNA methyltransferase [Croceicoccus sp. YJ47]QQN73775.1 RsmB/NOP family class I SAM-dependent RNA methyltransferase [Croceicoccus sp. YJ47]